MKRQIWVFCDLCVIYPLFENIEFSFSGKERNFAPFKKLLFCHCHHHRYLEKTNKHNVYVLVVKQYNYCLDSKKQTKLYFINLHTKDIPVHHNFLQTWKTNKNYKPKNKEKNLKKKFKKRNKFQNSYHWNMFESWQEKLTKHCGKALPTKYNHRCINWGAFKILFWLPSPLRRRVSNSFGLQGEIIPLCKASINSDSVNSSKCKKV